MDVEEIALLHYFYLRCKNIKQKKKKVEEEEEEEEKVWVHPFISNPSESGVFVKLYEDLLKYLDNFFNYVGISLASFDELLSCQDDLTKQDTVLRKSASPEEKLLITLR